MRRFVRSIFLGVAAIVAAQSSHAQYYSWGADRASLKWNRIAQDSLSIIHPQCAEVTARRAMFYVDSIKSDLSYGFKYPPLKIPFVFRVDNFASNGMVMWAPKRIEFLTTPAVDGYSMPWVKQLVAHEYRHAVQYNNLNKSTLRTISYIFGQQSSAASLLFPPLYALEGDAVMLETQMSSYGRGLQPSFTMGYRAMADEILDERDYLKWRCGSYRESIPDHYKLGYQMLSYAYDRYDENILDKSFEYIARNPQTIAPFPRALKKYYGTSSKELFYDSFAALVNFWDSLPQVENSAEMLSESEDKNHITYSYPIATQGGEVLVLRQDYKKPLRFISYDPQDSTQRVVSYIGSLSSRPAYAAGRVWWSEYRRSMLYAQDIDSQLCYMDIESGRPKRVKGVKNALYPTPIGNSVEHIAYVEYLPNGQYYIVEMLGGCEISRTEIDYPNEVHSMAWDNATERLYIIVTGNKGMWIEEQREGGFEAITKPAYVTISSLMASDGVLYFGSIASGKDEVHSLDLQSGVERQLSISEFGSFQPARVGDKIYMTTYDKHGYHLSSQDVNHVECEVEYSKLPKNLVNPNHKKWSVTNLDEINFTKEALDESQEKYPNERYQKAKHLINIHSWAPVRFDPFNILSEQSLDIGLGATLVSQNLLSSCDGFLSYGWDYYQGSILKGSLRYSGLGANFDVSSTYGGVQNVYMLSGVQGRKSYFDLSVSASLPLYFARGYHTRILTAYSGWNYSNGIVPVGLDYAYSFNPAYQSIYTDVTYDALVEGINKLSFGVSYTDFVRSALQNVATPFGYTLSANYAMTPANSEFSQLVALYGKLYIPGLAQNNSLTVAASYQNAIGGFDIDGYRPLSFFSSALIPHGFSYFDITNNKYLSAAAAYKFPLCYPEVGVGSLLYIKRLSLGLGADYASFNQYHAPRASIYSYGVDLMVDCNFISLAAASTSTVTLSLYKPYNRGLYFQFGFGLPF